MTPGPQPGDYAVVAYRSPGAVAKAIAVATRSRWTHAFIYLGGGRIGEAAPDGFRESNLADYDGSADLLWSRDIITQDGREAIVTRARMMVEQRTPYGWPDVVALGLASIGVRIPPVMKRLRLRGTLFCSQAVAVAYLGAGIRLAREGQETAEVTPADLAKRAGG